MHKAKEMTATTYLNESYFFILLALSVSIISLYFCQSCEDCMLR